MIWKGITFLCNVCSDIIVLEIILVRVLIQFDKNKFSSSLLLVLQIIFVLLLVFYWGCNRCGDIP